MTRNQVLIAIVNSERDFALARDHHWYRIPVSSAKKWVGERWPPQWLALYQTKIFGLQAFAVNYYARVRSIKEVLRHDLFPDEPLNEKTNNRYYQLNLGRLQLLSSSIMSKRWRRITFINTTWDKLQSADEINDLFDDSPLEDIIWQQLKRLAINAERQEFIKVKQRNYMLDFAIYCQKGKLNIETDGDTWHVTPIGAANDNLRDNALKSVGWSVLRFTTQQIREQATTYCVPTIADTINTLGGISEGTLLPRKITINAAAYQMRLDDILTSDE